MLRRCRTSPVPATLAALDLPDTTHLLVVGPKRFEPDRRAILALGRQWGTAARVPVDAETLAVNALLRHVVPRESLVDVIGATCDNGCPLFDAEGALLSYDGLHLTRAVAAYLAWVLLRDAPLALVTN